MTEGYATQFIGRRRELQELLPALREGSLQTVLITGLGGAGKSTLATRIARKLEIDDFIPIPVPSSKDNPLSAARLMQICNDAFLAAGQRDAHFTLSDSRLSVNDRLRYIITVLNNNRFLLLLDNFEVNLNESTRKILDSELAGFYTYMISNLVGESRAIITSRYRPADVQELPSIVQERTLGDFPESSFIKFLLLDGLVEQRYYNGEIPHDLLSKLYELLGGTPRFLGQIREVLKTIKAEELRSQLEAVTLPSKEKPTLLQQARDRYCEDIFTSRLYSYLKSDSQKALSRVAVYTIPVNRAGMRAVTGEPEEKLRSFTREWQDFALAYPEHELVASELWTVYGLLRNWLLAPERLSLDDRKAAHKAAGDFLNEMVGQDRTPELGMHLLYVDLEARAQYMFAGDYENAAEIMDRISGFYRRQGLYSEIQRLNEELLQYYEHPRIFSQIAWSYLDRSSYAAARHWYHRMLDAADGTDESETARALHGLATVDLNQGDYENAREKFQSALEINQQIGNRAGEAYTLHQLATIDLNQGDYETAREKFQTALEIKQQIGDMAGEAATLHNLATIDLNQGDYENAREKFQSALEINQQIGDRAGEAYTLHQLATIDLNQGDYENAREKFQTALEIEQQIGDMAGEVYTWFQLGMLATKQDRLADGIKLVAICFLIEKSIDHADTENDFRVLTGMASQLNYTDEQFNLMLKEVMEAYKKDGGSKLLEMAFLL
ncbi:MAG: tetratricopeptide repeat protein [Halobacteriota archaeon]